VGPGGAVSIAFSLLEIFVIDNRLLQSFKSDVEWLKRTSAPSEAKSAAGKAKHAAGGSFAELLNQVEEAHGKRASGFQERSAGRLNTPGNSGAHSVHSKGKAGESAQCAPTNRLPDNHPINDIDPQEGSIALTSDLMLDFESLYCSRDHVNGITFNVYRADNFCEKNPAYVVKGVYKGIDYEMTVNIKDIDLSNASEAEIVALVAHKQQKGPCGGIVDNSLDRPIRSLNEDGRWVKYDPFEKVDYAQIFRDWDAPGEEGQKSPHEQYNDFCSGNRSGEIGQDFRRAVAYGATSLFRMVGTITPSSSSEALDGLGFTLISRGPQSFHDQFDIAKGEVWMIDSYYRKTESGMQYWSQETKQWMELLTRKTQKGEEYWLPTYGGWRSLDALIGDMDRRISEHYASLELMEGNHD
jgi:hypothetical protein